MEPRQRSTVTIDPKLCGDLPKDMRKLIYIKLDNKITTILNKEIRNRYFEKYYVFLNLDNHTHILSSTNIKFIETYGLYIKLGNLKYQIDPNNIGISGFPRRTVSVEFLQNKLFNLFKNIISREYFDGNIIPKVKLVQSDTVITCAEFKKAFPNANFIGFIDWTPENEEAISQSQKFNGCRTSFPLPNGIDYITCDIYNGELYPSKTSADHIDATDTNDLSYLRELSMMGDNMEVLLKNNIVLPNLECLNFGYGFVDYDLLESILEKYPTVSQIKNFKIFSLDHIGIYKKFRHLIDEIYIVHDPRPFWRKENDKSSTEELTDVLCGVEDGIKDDMKKTNTIVQDLKKIIFNGYNPSIEKIINISRQFNVKITGNFEDMFAHLGVLTDMQPRECIKISVEMQIYGRMDNIVEIAKRVIRIYNLMAIYYDIDRLITNLDITDINQKRLRDHLLFISSRFN